MNRFFVALFFLSLTSFANATTPPTQANSAYVLMDYDTGEVLAQKNADTALPPASLTKMMTSYLLEQQFLSGKLKEDTPIKVSEHAWCRGSNTQSCMYVPLGETATAMDMLRGIIIQSGNDASKAVAEHIAGSESAFATMMNEEAKKIGMTNTHFKNATGMPAEGHKASAKDLALLAQTIIKHSGKYYPIYAEKEFTYNNITQQNRNTLLISDPTVDGLKTGHTDEAGYCLVSSSKKDNMRLIAVVMGAKSMKARADQSKELLAFGFDSFHNIQQASKGEEITSISVKFGQQKMVAVLAQNDLKILAKKNQNLQISTQTTFNPDIKAPISQGQVLGELTAIVNGKAIASVPLVAKDAVEEVGFVAKLWQSLTGWIGDLF